MYMHTFVLQVELIRRDYVANGGWETFLSYEDPEQGHLSSCMYISTAVQ